MMTLFAVMNGDEVADTFNQLTTNQPVASQLFLYTCVRACVRACGVRACARAFARHSIV